MHLLTSGLQMAANGLDFDIWTFELDGCLCRPIVHHVKPLDRQFWMSSVLDL